MSMDMQKYRKELQATEHGQERLRRIEQLVRDIWNNDKLFRHDIAYIAFLLRYRAETS